MRSEGEINIDLYIGTVYDLPDLRTTPYNLFNPRRACWEIELPAKRAWLQKGLLARLTFLNPKTLKKTISSLHL